MKTQEKEALLQYLEFHLIKLIEGVETHIQDPDIIGDLYDKSYGILEDMEITISTQTMLDAYKNVNS